MGFFLSLSGFNLNCWKGIHFSWSNFLIFLLLFFGLIFSFHFWFRDLLREFAIKYEILLMVLFLLFFLFLAFGQVIQQHHSKHMVISVGERDGLTHVVAWT